MKLSNVLNPNQFVLSGKLVEKAQSLGYDLSVAEIGYNNISGNVYLWSEYEQFTMYIFEGDLKEEINYVWYNYDNGDEVIFDDEDITKYMGNDFFNANDINRYCSEVLDKGEEEEEKDLLAEATGYDKTLLDNIGVNNEN